MFLEETQNEKKLLELIWGIFTEMTNFMRGQHHEEAAVFFSVYIDFCQCGFNTKFQK